LVDAKNACYLLAFRSVLKIPKIKTKLQAFRLQNATQSITISNIFQVLFLSETASSRFYATFG
jgi:hypothetical protein